MGFPILVRWDLFIEKRSWQQWNITVYWTEKLHKAGERIVLYRLIPMQTCLYTHVGNCNIYWLTVWHMKLNKWFVPFFYLTYRDKMAAILQTIFLRRFSCMKSVVFCFKFLIEICSQWSNQQYNSISSENGLARTGPKPLSELMMA